EPIFIAEQALVELARRMARQFLDEIDLARRLQPAKLALGEGSQFAGQFRACSAPVDRLDDRDQPFAKIVVRNADYRDVEDRRMRDERILDLARIDIHAARDDHEALAVRKIEIALLVHPADIAE